MVNKMPGYKKDKYANLRTGYTYMFGHCGKKLLFMGQDFGQEREWSEERELDWFLLLEEENLGLQTYVKELLKRPPPPMSPDTFGQAVDSSAMVMKPG